MSKLFKAGYIKHSEDTKLIEPKPIIIDEQVEQNYSDDEDVMDITLDDEIDIPKEILEIVEKAKNDAHQIVTKAKEQAEIILQEAEENKSNMLLEAKEESKKLYNNAKETGYNDGHNIGYNDGQAKAEQIYSSKISEINEVLLAAQKQKIKELVEARDLIINISYDIARKVVLDNNEILSNQIDKLVEKSIEKVKSSEKIEIIINHVDFQKVNDALPNYKKMLQGKSDIVIQLEQYIEPGSCEIVTEMGMIDAKISTQFEEIKKALLSIDLGSDSIDKA